MRLLLDMNLPPSLTAMLRSAGFTAVHWSEIGDPRAADTTVLDWAHANGHVIVTHCLDFGALLAAGGLRSPSVIQLRTADLTPDTYAGLLIAAHACSYVIWLAVSGDAGPSWSARSGRRAGAWVWAVAKGSLVNKSILVAAALLLSALAPCGPRPLMIVIRCGARPAGT